MAPTKKDVPQKATKKRTLKQKPAKPKLKSPTVVKVQIRPEPLGRSVTSQQHFDLANAVIQAQLAKPVDKTAPTNTIENQPNSTPESKTIKKVPRKRKKPDEFEDTMIRNTIKEYNEPSTKRKRTQCSNNMETTCSTTRSASRTCSGQTPLATLKALQDLATEELGEIKKKPGPKSRTTIDPCNILYVQVVKLPDNEYLRSKNLATPKRSVKNEKQRKICDIVDYGSTSEDFVEVRGAVKVKSPPKKPAKNKTVQKKVAEEKAPKTPPAAIKRPRARPKFVSERSKQNVGVGAKVKGKTVNGKQTQDAIKRLKNAIVDDAAPNPSVCSSINSGSDLSWTKDISSSSTTTCVTVSSNSFLKPNSKVPPTPFKNTDIKDSVDSSSSDSDSSSASELGETVTSRPEPDLSTSSLSPKCKLSDTELLTIEVEKLAECMKRFESRISKYIDPSVDVDLIDTPMDALAIACEDFKRFFERKDPSHVQTLEKPVEPSTGLSHTVSVTPSMMGNDKCQSDVSAETFTSDNYNYVPFEINDDEDALSLYAESITGIDSSKISTPSASNVSHVHETYTPKPKTPLPVQIKYSYRPTKIDELPKTKIMCEKQNADSTSISKEVDANKGVETAVASEEPRQPEAVQPSPNTQLLLNAQNPVSIVYKGVCFFNMASKCKNGLSRCRFWHAELPNDVVQHRIASLPEEMMLKQYLLTLNYPQLFRRYGLIFLAEVLRRSLTRLVVKMAMDFSRIAGMANASQQDHVNRVAALELTLLHLNDVPLDVCADLLTNHLEGKLLCHVLLRCMADSPNFSRFRKVFVKLAAFLATIETPTDLVVVEKVLERICILQGDEALARAMLSVIKNTDAAIFDNGLMQSFEVYLCNFENDGVFEEYQRYKTTAMSSRVTIQCNAASPTPPAQDMLHTDRERYTSPDTTNLDGLKNDLLPKIIRTIDTTQPINKLSDVIVFKPPPVPPPRRHYTRGGGWRPRGPMIRPWPGPPLNRRVVFRNPTNYGMGRFP